jgi:isopentenyl-diphosphate delta-isomerase
MSQTQTITVTAEPTLEGYDAEQVRLMEERCILVDDTDKAYGEGSKKKCEFGPFTAWCDARKDHCWSTPDISFTLCICG